jgi:hypothetical protein
MEREIDLNHEQAQATPSEREITLPDDAACVRLRFEVPTGARLTVELEAVNPDGALLDRQTISLGGSRPLPTQPIPWGGKQPGLVRSLARSISGVSAASLAAWLTWFSLGLYAIIRLVGLPSFPIYFFTDEAVQTVLAADFLRDGLRGGTGEVLPTFFQNGTQFNLSTSVYLQVVPYFFLGKSIWVTRGVAALATLLAAACVGLILKNVFKSPYPWLAVLFLSITPTWFLHSRTAFETGLATTFYAAFLYFYLMYRAGYPRRLFGAVAFGALTFYSYSPARLVILLTAVLLLLSDARYHWSQRRVVLAGFGLALVLALPYARFLNNHPEATALQMRLLGSPWVTEIPFWEKARLTVGEYLHGLSPLYWYLPHTLDLSRHTMSGYGHLLRPTLPLGLLGVGMAFRSIRRPEYRAVLVAILAAPAGAALVRLGVTRAMTMVIPMAILTALAAAMLLEWARRRWSLAPGLLSLGAFLILAGGNLFLLVDALANGPLWYREYSLTGMQYGARQLFGEIADYLDARPNTHIVLSPSWANGTDVIARFFFDDPLPFELGSAEGYYSTAKPQAEDQLFIMIPEEFHNLPGNLFTSVEVEKTLPYPDGQPGFYFVRLAYAPDIQESIAAELAQRRELGSLLVPIDGEQVPVSFTQLDMGEIANLFDGDPHTLVRTYSVNPMYLVFDFPYPRPVESLTVRIGGTATRLTVRFWPEGQDEPVELVRGVEEATMPRDIVIDLPGARQVRRIMVEILNVNDTSDGHVHVWEVTFK